MDLVASLVPNSEAKIIPHAGHFAMIERRPPLVMCEHFSQRATWPPPLRRRMIGGQARL
jgi:hypothetical protein